MSEELPEKSASVPQRADAEAVQAGPEGLLSLPFALVCGAAISAMSAQLLVTADDFLRLYETLMVDLPWLTKVLVEHPRGVPLLLLTTGVFVLSAGKIPRPRGEALAAVASNAARYLAVGALLTAGLFVYAMPIALQEVQKALQQ